MTEWQGYLIIVLLLVIAVDPAKKLWSDWKREQQNEKDRQEAARLHEKRTRSLT